MRAAEDMARAARDLAFAEVKSELEHRTGRDIHHLDGHEVIGLREVVSILDTLKLRDAFQNQNLILEGVNDEIASLLR